jgi:CRP/FNR family transcriptional regulator, nitrogen fixation regulation protein
MTLQASSYSSIVEPRKRFDGGTLGQTRAIRPMADTIICHRGDCICLQGDPARWYYSVDSGMVVRYAIRPDGRRQILDLLLPGDIFGFTVCSDYGFSAEAMMDGTTVWRVSFQHVDSLSRSDSQFANGVRNAAVASLLRLEEHLLVMGRVTAPSKVGSFLIEASNRFGNQSPEVCLPISRYDIADYLAISVETVSRALGNLKHRGGIELTGPREVKIIDRDMLEAG